MAETHEAQTDDEKTAAMLRRIGWLVLAAVWLLVALSLASFHPYDPPSHAAAPLNDVPQNWCGWVGAWIAYKLRLMFGVGTWVLLAGWLTYLLAAATGRRPDQMPLRITGVAIMAITTSAFLTLLAPDSGALPEGPGGLVAIFAVQHLHERMATLGTLIVLAMCFGVGAMLAVDRLLLALPYWLLAACRAVGSAPWPRPAAVGAALKGVVPSPVWLGRRRGDKAGSLGRLKRKLKPKHTDVDHFDADRVTAEGPDAEAMAEAEADAEQQGAGAATAEAEPEEAEDEEAEWADDPEEDAEYEDADDEGELAEAEDEDPDGEEEQSVDREQLKRKIRNLPISFANRNKPQNPPTAPPQDLSGYQFPGYDLLSEPDSGFSQRMEQLVREQAETLEHALQTFRIDASVESIDAGPVITLYEVRLAPGTKVNSLHNIAKDLARELKAQNIRVVPNTAGKSTVGIEVPNLKKEKVRLKELMQIEGRDAFDEMSLPMFLGKDASGDPLTADLSEMPHMLIAGTTGSGKSVCINSIIMSFLFCRRPDELKLVLVDPKMVEMAQFRDVPHLMCPVVTEMGKAAAILEWAVTKMEERYELLAEAGVRQIDAYNELSWEELKERFDPQNEHEEAKIPRKLPRMVFVIDELADLMLTHKEVENHIVRIAQKARAVGIHLILATQRPQANVVTGLIKSNMPCRIAFKVASGMDSRIVLDTKGAELLLGQGDMLFLSPKNSELGRAQGTLVDDREVRQAVRFLKSVASQSFEPQLVQLKNPDEATASPTERDPLFEDAVRIVLESKRGSVSLLQRRLTIGYSRASRLIEQMADAGIIGEYKGSQAREVNISLEEWEQMKAAVEQDEASGYAADEPDESGEPDAAEGVEDADAEDGEDEQDDEQDDDEDEELVYEEEGEYEDDPDAEYEEEADGDDEEYDDQEYEEYEEEADAEDEPAR